MQKAFVAIIFALALSSAVADFTINANGWAKTPVSVCEDSNINCTNRSTLTLGGLTDWDVNVLSYDNPINTSVSNMSSFSWNMWAKLIDAKALVSTVNNSYAFKAPKAVQFCNGYVIGNDNANDTNGVPQLWIYQTKLTGGAELPRIQISNNTNANFTPRLVGGGNNWITFFIFYIPVAGKVNYTSFTLGQSSVGKEYTLPAGSYNVSNDGQIDVIWGEALGYSQVYAGWRVGDAYQVAVVDFSSGLTINAATLGGYNKNYSCSTYATDKKNYGVWCSLSDVNTTTVYVSANTTNLLKMFTINNRTIQSISKVYAYSSYLAFFYKDSSNPNATVLSHEIWDVENFVVFKNKTDYVTYNSKLTNTQQYRVPQGGVYTMLYNYKANASDPNSTKTGIQAGLTLEGSYLTTIFGSLMALIAGLLLF